MNIEQLSASSNQSSRLYFSDQGSKASLIQHLCFFIISLVPPVLGLLGIASHCVRWHLPSCRWFGVPAPSYRIGFAPRIRAFGFGLGREPSDHPWDWHGLTPWTAKMGAPTFDSVKYRKILKRVRIVMTVMPFEPWHLPLKCPNWILTNYLRHSNQGSPILPTDAWVETGVNPGHAGVRQVILFHNYKADSKEVKPTPSRCRWDVPCVFFCHV